MEMIEVKNLVKEYRRKSGKAPGNMPPIPPGMMSPPAVPESERPDAGSRMVHIKAVDDISFSIDEGEMVGYIGANGAGKSTTIKMLTGILTPSSGTINVNGLIPYRQRKKNAKKIGVVFGQRTQLWWDLPVIDSYRLLRHIYDLPVKEFRENLELFQEVLEMREFMYAPVRQLSLGQRMRADIAASLLHNPRILYLDEPTIGLDPYAKEKMRNFIRMANKERKITVILTTHDMSDIEDLCKRVMIIEKGKLVYDNSLDQMKKDLGNEKILKIEFSNSDITVPPGLRVTKEDGNTKWFSYRKDCENASEIISLLCDKNEIVDLSVNDASVESIVRRIYKSGVAG